MKKRCYLSRYLILSICLALMALSVGAAPVESPEVVALFNGPMPTGVTVSHTGRVFVCFPRWGDKVAYTVAEVKSGHTLAYPNTALNKFNRAAPGGHLISVQSVVVDPKDRLWLLDTGSIKFGPTQPGGPKIVGVDLHTNRVFQSITLPREVALSTTYLNDIRFDLRRGKGGMAFITDSSGIGPNGIIVVNLATGRSWRRLNDHPSTKAEKNFVPIVEGQSLMQKPKNAPATPLKLGSDGIAISSDGKTLYYCPLASRTLYSVSVDALANEKLSNAQVAKTVHNLGIKGASDGLESDASGQIYITDYENHDIKRGMPGGPYTEIAAARPYEWPDTLSVATNGYLYFTGNQLQRQADYHNGKDLRVKPYRLYRIRIDAKPVLLK